MPNESDLSTVRGAVMLLCGHDGRNLFSAATITAGTLTPGNVQELFQALFDNAREKADLAQPWVGWLLNEPPSKGLVEALEVLIGQGRAASSHPAVVLIVSDPELLAAAQAAILGSGPAGDA